MNVRNVFLILSTGILAAIAGIYFIWPPILWSLILVLPIVFIGYKDILQTKKAIRRNFPVIGNFRYMLEEIRPEIMQYFVETDTEGRPINRIHRSIVYQRAKQQLDTTPFGTQENVYDAGYEWMNHSIAALDAHDLEENPRVKVGSPDCTKPYDLSVFNVSAMSFGSLSKNAIMALNGGAAIGGFAHNTGEGGISPYHDKFGGDLIYQIGTGYFGCRTKE